MCDKNQKTISQVCANSNVKIIFVPVEDKNFDKSLIPEGHGWSSEIFHRLYIPKLLPDADKIIYLDSDTIVLSDLNDLYDENTDNCYAAAVKDITEYIDEYCNRLNLDRYFNSGVLLLNITKLREDDAFNKFIQFAQNNSDIIFCPDQDILNVVFKNNIKFIDYNWNVQQFIPNTKNNAPFDIKIFHYSGKIKPWRTKYAHENKRYFFEYFHKLPLSFKIKYYYIPYRKELLKEFRKNFIWYSETKKEIIIFKFFRIKINV